MGNLIFPLKDMQKSYIISRFSAAQKRLSQTFRAQRGYTSIREKPFFIAQ